jgi:hypothetical protein
LQSRAACRAVGCAAGSVGWLFANRGGLVNDVVARAMGRRTTSRKSPGTAANLTICKPNRPQAASRTQVATSSFQIVILGNRGMVFAITDGRSDDWQTTERLKGRRSRTPTVASFLFTRSQTAPGLLSTVQRGYQRYSSQVGEPRMAASRSSPTTSGTAAYMR